jgi:Cadherin-like
METALAAVIMIFIVLFGVLTLSNTLMSTQDTMHVNWEESDLRLQEQGRTGLSVVRTLTHAGTQVDLTVKNSGSTRLADYKQWDMIVEYHDGNALSGSHIAWLPYTKELTAAGAWTVQGIYADAENSVPEAYDPGIFDPGEEMIIDLQLDPAIAAGSYVQVVVSPSNGVSTSTIFKRNVPPVLATNAVIVVNSGESVTIAQDMLETTDVDDLPSDLAYTLITAPALGTLTPDATFTQADINNGLLHYANSGAGASDSFEFSVTDGEDTIGSYVVQIQINMPPTVDVNNGMTLPHGTAGMIGDLMLKASDADNSASELVFTVTKAPSQGNLSMSTFTQDDIDNAHLSYSNTGSSAGADSFEFTVTDGHKVIGPFTFPITVS